MDRDRDGMHEKNWTPRKEIKSRISSRRDLRILPQPCDVHFGLIYIADTSHFFVMRQIGGSDEDLRRGRLRTAWRGQRRGLGMETLAGLAGPRLTTCDGGLYRAKTVVQQGLRDHGVHEKRRQVVGRAG